MLLLVAVLIFQAFGQSSPLCKYVPPSDNPPVDIDCQLEVGSYSSGGTPPPTTTLTVVEYNIDRNGYGGDGSREAGLNPIINLLNESNFVPLFDVLLLSEVARGCPQYGNYISGTQAIAKSFFSYYAYAVEYIEMDQTNETSECTIGNAILSRYPLTNLTQYRFQHQCCRYGGRAGGRISLAATIDTSPGVNVLFHSTHLESGQSSPESVLEGMVIRTAQAEELVNITLPIPVSYKVVGGDLNSPFRDDSGPVVELEKGGYYDAHRFLPPKDRNTCPDDPLSEIGLSTYDYLLSISDGFINPGVCTNYTYCGGWSDHVPIFGVFSCPTAR